MKRILPVILIIIILLGVPGTLMVTHGNLFPPEEEPYHITALIDQINVDDSFTIQLIQGAQLAQYQAEKDGYKVEQTVITYNSPSWMEDFEKRNAVSNLVISLSSDAADVLLAAARANPDKLYVSIDMSYGDEELPPNLENIVFRSNEPSCVAGYVAGTLTETGKIGFLSGMDIPSVNSFYYGFCAGADLAAADWGKDIEVIRKTANTFNEANLGYYLTKQLYQEGCDICFMVAGATGAGGMKAAEEMKKYIIGVDNDQGYLAPGFVLFSVVKDIKSAVKKSVIEHIENNDLISGGTISIGYAEDGVGIVSYLKPVITAELEERADILESLIQLGFVPVPDDEESYHKFDAEEMKKFIYNLPDRNPNWSITFTDPN